MTMEDNMDELHAKSLSDLQKQVPDEDFELIAKYVYARLAEHDPFMNALPKGKYYANAENGLRSFFVTKEGTIRNFKEEGTLKPFIDEYLGFSRYMNDNYFSYSYLTKFTDLLNSMKAKVQSKVFKKNTSHLNDGLELILNKLGMYISEMLTLHDEYFEQLDIEYKGNFSFLFDVLHYRKEILSYDNMIKLKFTEIEKLYKETEQQYGRCFILYAIAFYGLKLLNNDFQFEWKKYNEVETEKYRLLEEFSSNFSKLLESYVKPGKSIKYNHVLFICLIKHIITHCKELIKEDFGSRNKTFSKKLDKIIPSEIFLSHLLGGKVKAPSRYFLLRPDDKIEAFDIVKFWIDAEMIKDKLNSSNNGVIKYYSDRKSFIKRDKNAFKKGAVGIKSAIYAFFVRAIEYYCAPLSKMGNLERWRLFKISCNYLPNDFIQGDMFNVNNTPYNRKNFFDREIFNTIYREKDVEQLNCYKEFFQKADNPRYYKRNFVKLFAQYNYVCITFEDENETWKCSEEEYQEEIENSIENYCDSILSQRQPETPHCSH